MNKTPENPFYELCSFIGEYSQNVCGSSYNQHEVRAIWNSGQLNERAEHPCYMLDSAWPDRPSDYQAEMNRLVKAAGVWPVGYRSDPGYLPWAEKKIVDLDEVCHGDVLRCAVQNYACGSGYNEQLIIEFFYDFWEKVKKSGEEFQACVFYARMVERPDFLELRKKFEMSRKLSARHKLNEARSDNPALTFEEKIPPELSQFFNNWVRQAVG